MTQLISETPNKQPGSAISALPETALTGLLNHVLSQHSWARAKLRSHVGKTVQLRLPLSSIVLSIQEEGYFAPASPGAQIDATLTPSPLAWLMASDKRFIAGGKEADLAQELADTLGKMRWDAEEDLSRIFGDIASHRLVSTANQVVGWHRHAIQAIAKSWVEDSQGKNTALAQSESVHVFFKEVNEVHDRVEQLEKKIRQLGQ